MKLDALITNASVKTLDPRHPQATTVGIYDGKIVGLDDEVASLTAHETIDAQGACVTAGFNDVHCHTTWYGLTLASLDVEKLGSMDELYARVEQAAQNTPEGEWINATGFAQQDYNDEYPSLEVLDRITNGRPLFMRKASGHAAIANTRALELAGILDPDFQVPAGGKVVRDGDGNPTGLVEETAQSLIQDLIRPYSQDAIVEALDLATAQYAKEGITSFGEAGIAAGWIGHSPVEVTAYMRARREGKLRARAQLMPMIEALHTIKAHPADNYGVGLDLGVVTGFGDDWINIGPTKVFMDGAMSGETAALTKNYHGKDHPGYLQEDPEVLRQQILTAYQSGWSLAVHAIGDLACNEATRFITEAVDRFGAPASGIPNRIEHAGMVADELIPTLAKYNIAVTPQAAFADAIGDSMNVSLGDERVRLLYRAKSFLDAGVLVPGTSDRPCADGNVMRGIQAFVDRRTRSGDVFGSEAECITPQQALEAYTSVAAEASGHGAIEGTVTPGKLADLVFLDADPTAVDPSTIAQIPVRATMVGGEFTHREL